MPKYPVPGGGGATNAYGYYKQPDKYGEYGYVNLDEIITNFIATYIGTGKLLEGTLKGDVNYHSSSWLC